MRPFAMETAAILVHSLNIVHRNGHRGGCQAVAMLYANALLIFQFWGMGVPKIKVYGNK